MAVGLSVRCLLSAAALLPCPRSMQRAAAARTTPLSQHPHCLTPRMPPLQLALYREYQRIARDLASIGDTVLISATKEGIKFSATGDIGTANITLRCSGLSVPIPATVRGPERVKLNGSALSFFRSTSKGAWKNELWMAGPVSPVKPESAAAGGSRGRGCE